MKLKKAIPFLLIGVLSCGGDEEEVIPDSVIPKEKFIPLLVDLHVLESHFQRQFGRVDLYRDALDSSSFYVFKDHETSKAAFLTSINFYALEPDTLFLIYEAALDTLNLRTDRVN